LGDALYRRWRGEASRLLPGTCDGGIATTQRDCELEKLSSFAAFSETSRDAAIENGVKDSCVKTVIRIVAATIDLLNAHHIP
jgi:hypothetical protein